ncbi:ABC transporter permease (plasmid) [Deinococcus metallilatus]|uniref:Peptide/nickel transport system permease protein n=1 Tax=Deinococcus metallilatus TaxID=1211322 RepID=A0ABR6MV67_9DEIO|nr:ABC transporter permease [Deinococcus metallilatus]MBB5295832.1 peptide/nickel transport system permease protein [Deinococcus metallilatus]QBY06742.1 ABC transporter permease [Deinococcus metallilatus]
MASSAVEASPRRGRSFFSRVLGHRTLRVGLVLLALVLLATLAGQLFTPQDPVAMNFAATFQPPSAAHLLGTDNFGRDVFSRILAGAWVSVRVALIAVGLSALVGVTLGTAAGYYRGWVDEVLMRLMDVLMAFPALLLAIAVMAILGRGVENAMIAIAVVYTPIFARITRGSILTVREEEYLTAARALGQTDLRLMWRHVLPNALGPIIVQTSLSLAFAVLAESALSFFGLGTQPPTPSWGLMLSEGRSFLLQAPWLGLFPGVAIMLTVLSFNLVGDGLRDLLDPRMRQRLR